MQRNEGGASASTSKHKKGAPLSSKVRRVVINVFDFFTENYPKWTVEKRVLKTAAACGVSVGTVWNIKRELKKTGTVVTPGKHRKQKARFSALKCDSFALAAIRRLVHSFFMRNEPPTLDKVKRAMDQDDSLPRVARSTLHRILKKVGFRFKKRSRQSLLIEREDLILWRHRYLREIKQFREEGRPIFYLDETWTFAGLTTPKSWQDTNLKTSRQSFLEGFGRGCLRDPTGKGERLIVLHVGNEYGFLDGAGLVFRTTGKLADYHGDMNSENFEKWVKEVLLPRLPPRAVIVMDNAKYHSRELDKAPTSGSTKKKMHDWLVEKGIDYDKSLTRPRLYEIISQNKDKTKKYAVDEMAKSMGFTVLRLPPYHCELNPIEMVWAQVKGYVKSRNTTFKVKDVEELTKESIVNVTSEQWKNYCEHVIKEEAKMWELEGIMDEVVDRVIIELGDESDSEDSEYDSDNEDSETRDELDNSSEEELLD